MKYDTLFQYLPNRQENAIHMNELADQIGVNARTVRHLILDARKAGYPIISGNYGYFYDNEEPDELTREYYYNRYNSAMTTLSSLKDTRSRLKDAEMLAEGR